MKALPLGDRAGERRRRADAEKNIERIVQAAMELLQAEPEAGLEEIAAAARVSRSTIYRHFASREDLVRAARQRAGERADENQTDALRPPGELAGGRTPLDVADVLNKVPPHLLGDQIVAEAQRLVGVSSVALYLVDIDGTMLLRLAGSEEFPPELDAPLAVGPEIPREGLAALRAVIENELPGSVMAPMLLRGRAIGVLLAVGASEQPLVALGRQAAAALALANGYTDVFDTTRRRKETSPAAEIQQNLLPPRIARISGGILAGNVLPGYEIGGDWFDYIENPDGAWVGVADSMGRGTTAAALGGVALGAFRAERRVNAHLDAAALAIHHTMQEVAVEGAFVNVILGRWHGRSSTFNWITCGHQPPLLMTTDGELLELEGSEHPALGLGEPARRFTIDRRRLEPGERLLLISDGSWTDAPAPARALAWRASERPWRAPMARLRPRCGRCRTRSPPPPLIRWRTTRRSSCSRPATPEPNLTNPANWHAVCRLGKLVAVGGCKPGHGGMLIVTEGIRPEVQGPLGAGQHCLTSRFR